MTCSASAYTRWSTRSAHSPRTRWASGPRNFCGSRSRAFWNAPRSSSWPWATTGTSMFSAGARCRRWTLLRCRARYRTCGWGARAGGLGMGWVSLFDPRRLADLLGMPADAEPVAILCLGPVPEFPDRPALEIDQWTSARPLAEFVAENRWTQPPDPGPGQPAPGVAAGTASTVPSHSV